MKIMLNERGVYIGIMILLSGLFIFLSSPTLYAAESFDRKVIGEILNNLYNGALPTGSSNYISLTNSISPQPVYGNSQSYADTGTADRAFFKVYGLDGMGSKTVSFSPVGRDVGRQACENYTLTVKVYSLTGDEQSIYEKSQPDTTVEPYNLRTDSDGNVTCSIRPFSVNMNALRNSSITEHTFGTQSLKIGLVVIELQPTGSYNTSPTFKIDIAEPARMGFSGPVGGSNPRVAIYPSNLYNNQTIDFDFMPPCSSPIGPRTINWEDSDRGVNNGNQDRNSNFRNDIAYSPAPPGSINSLTARLYEGGVNPVGSVDSYGGSGIGSYTFNHARWNNYKLRFSNVTGGNRIIFYLPYDSADQSATCSRTDRVGRENWQVENTTYMYPGIGPWTAPWDNDGNSSTPTPTWWWAQKARTAFKDARYQHNVYNQNSSEDPAPAGASGHRSFIEYRVKRGNSDTWRNSENNSSGGSWNDGWARKTNVAQPNNSFNSYQPLILDPGDAYTLHDSAGANDQNSRPQDADLECLTKSDSPGSSLPPCVPGNTGYRQPVARYDACGSSGTTNCQYYATAPPGKSGPGWYMSEGDKYCERVVTYGHRMTNGTLTEGPNVSSQRCIELNGANPVICRDWQVQKSASIDGPREANNAWVEDTYYYKYEFSKSGQSPATAPITFNLKRTGHADSASSRSLGFWNPSYSVGPFGPEHGGQTFTSSIDYSPNRSSGADNCGSTGSDTAGPVSVTVPWYYHLIPKVSPITNTTPQGNSIVASPSIKNPEIETDPELKPTDNEFGGRKHTYSRATSWRVMEFKTNNAATAESVVPQNREGAVGEDDPCDDLTAFGVPGLSGCAVASSGSNTVQIQSLDLADYTRTAQIDPVGTIVCYVLGVYQPTHRDDNLWRYSQAQCTTIVKPAKVRFENSDLNVGRGIPGTADPNSCTPNLSAQARASGVQSYVTNNGLPQQNLYGSWVEYGIFATADITNLGSAATPTPLAGNNKLSFRSNPAPYGNFAFPRQCTDNFMTNLWQGRDTTANPAETITLPDPNLGSITAVRWDQAAYSSATPPAKTVFKSSSTISISNPSPPPLPAPSRLIVNASGNPNSPNSSKPQMRVTIKPRTGGSCINATGAPMTGGEITYTRTLGTRNALDASAAPLATNTVYGYEFANLELGSCGPEYIRVVLLNDYDTAATPAWLGPGPFPPTVAEDTSLRITSIQVNSKTYNSGNTTYDDQTTTPGRYTAWPRREGTLCADPDVAGNNSYWTRPGGTLAQWLGGDDKRTKTGNWAGMNNGQTNICSGMELFVDAAAGAQPDTVAPLLDRGAGDPAGLEGKDIVVYAQKTSAGGCNPADGSGYIRIRKNIEYPDTLNDVQKIPRIILLADCGITIDSAVNRVDAWLITKGIFSTCDAIAGSAYPQLIQSAANLTNTQLSKTDCNGSPDNSLAGSPLYTNGPIVAKTWRVWRTWGSDLEGGSGIGTIMSENFTLRPDQLISTYNLGVRQGKQSPVQEVNLPPRY